MFDDVNKTVITFALLHKVCSGSAVSDLSCLGQMAISKLCQRKRRRRGRRPPIESPTYLDHGEEGGVGSGLLGDRSLLGSGSGSHCVELGVVTGCGIGCNR